MPGAQKLRWFQFTLRGLLIAVTLGSLGLGSVVWRVEEGERQKQAIGQIRARYGWGRRSGTALVVYDYQVTSTFNKDGNLPDFQLQVASPTPKFLEDQLGFDSCHGVVMVLEGNSDYWSHPDATADEKKQFWRQAAGLRRLIAFEPPPVCFDPQGLRQFAGHRRLQHLNLQRSPVENDHLELVAQVRGLRSLDISSSKITDAGLHHLSLLVELRSLDVCCTEIDGSGLRELADLPHLQRLDLSNTHLDGHGLKHLRSFTNLTEIDITAYNNGHPMTVSLDDDDLDTLRYVPQLRTVLIWKNRFSRAKIRKIESETSIVFLDPWRNPVGYGDVENDVLE